MNILLIAYYYPPINSGGTQRPLKMGKYLSRFGHRVTIITQTYGPSMTEPGNPCVMRFHDISHNKNRVGFRRKMQWLGLRLITELLNKLGIYHSIYSWWKKSVIRQSQHIMEEVQPDVIIATYPPVETLEIGIHLSRTYDVPLIADFRDGLIFEPIETKRMTRYSCIKKVYQSIEREAVMQAAAVTTIAEPITGYYKDTYRPPRAEVISNAFDPEDLEQLPKDVVFDKDCFNIVFTGRFGMSDKCNRVDYFFDALRRLIREDHKFKEMIRLHLVGEYREDELKELHDLTDMGVIVCHGLVPRLKALAFQQAADLLLIITLPTRVSSVSAKIFEYLFAGKPILSLTYKTVLEQIIDETGTGWNVHPQKPEAIADLLKKIVTEPEFYNSLLPNQQAIAQYTANTQMEKLNRLLEDIHSKNHVSPSDGEKGDTHP